MIIEYIDQMQDWNSGTTTVLLFVKTNNDSEYVKVIFNSISETVESRIKFNHSDTQQIINCARHYSKG